MSYVYLRDYQSALCLWEAIKMTDAYMKDYQETMAIKRLSRNYSYQETIKMAYVYLRNYQSALCLYKRLSKWLMLIWETIKVPYVYERLSKWLMFIWETMAIKRSSIEKELYWNLLILSISDRLIGFVGLSSI